MCAFHTSGAEFGQTTVEQHMRYVVDLVSMMQLCSLVVWTTTARLVAVIYASPRYDSFSEL